MVEVGALLKFIVVVGGAGGVAYSQYHSSFCLETPM